MSWFLYDVQVSLSLFYVQMIKSKCLQVYLIPISALMTEKAKYWCLNPSQSLKIMDPVALCLFSLLYLISSDHKQMPLFLQHLIFGFHKQMPLFYISSILFLAFINRCPYFISAASFFQLSIIVQFFHSLCILTKFIIFLCLIFYVYYFMFII